MSARAQGAALWWITGWAARAALRERVATLLGVLGLLLVSATLILRDLEFGGAEPAFLAETGQGVIFLFGTLFAVLLPSLRWAQDLEARTLLPILARPVCRESYFLGQALGLGLVVALFGVGLFGPLAVPGLAQDGAGLEALPGEAARALLRAWVIVALVLFLGSFLRGALLTATLGFALVVGGQVMPLVALSAPTVEGPASALLQLVQWLVPNLGAFTSDGPTLVSLLVYGGLYIAAFLGLGAWIFRGREV